MKNRIISILQRVIGYERYLFLFSIFRITFIQFGSRRKEYLYFESLIPKNGFVVIVGANIGITTVPIARSSKRSLDIYEPHHINHKVLSRVLRFFKISNCQSYPVAIGDQNISTKISLPIIEGAKKHGLAHLSDRTDLAADQVNSSPVQMHTLDSRPELSEKDISAMKIIAENYEYKILLGARSVLERCKPMIYCELWPNQNRELVISYLADLGYTCYFLLENELEEYTGVNYKGMRFLFLTEKTT